MSPTSMKVEGANWFGPVRLSIFLFLDSLTPAPLPTTPIPPIFYFYFRFGSLVKKSLTQAPLPAPPPKKKNNLDLISL